MQQWWNNLIEWFTSNDGWRVISGAIIPAAAIIVAGIIAAAIGRASTKRLIAFQDRQQKAAAVTALIGAGQKAATWSSLSAPDKQHVEHLTSEAETRVRLLPVAGASVAADWAARQLAEMKRNSAGFSYQSEQTLIEFRDGLVNWQVRPNRTRKLFAQDLAAWKYDDSSIDHDLVTKQQQWASEQVASDSAPATSPTVALSATKPVTD
ncbi:MAG: hypothetical protein ABJB03_03925 [Rhodoglobus sp.]